MQTPEMLKRGFVACAGLLILAAPLVAGPLPSDSRIITGKLDNGVTWMYRQHDKPPGKMALMIHIDTGSLNETDGQRGLAHFMEHMAFNGTDNFPPGELLPYFESIGMEFGADLNAFTSFDQTAYMLFTPDTKTEQLDKALMCLSDYVFRALLVEEEVDKERGVVLEEARTGKSASQRIRDRLWPELFEGSRFAERLPIGKEEIIANFPRSELVDYYRSWYRPEKMTVMLVGDTAPGGVIPLIEKWFGQYKPESSAREPLGPEFKPFSKQRALVVTDPEQARCDVVMWNIFPGRPPTTTVEQFRTELVEYIGTWIVNRRHEERVNKGEGSYRRASASVMSFFHDAVLVNSSATGEPEDWPKMLEELIAEVHRAGEHGFTAREFELANKEILADAERAVRTEPTRDARGFLFEMLSAVNDEEPVLSAQQELDLYTTLLLSVRREEVTAAFQKHFTPGTFAYVVTMVEKEGVNVPPRDEVLAAARAAWARTVEPIHEEDAPTDLLASLPTPGKVVESSLDEDLKITSAWLDNGVRVHHRFMDYKEDTVLVSISLAGGSIEETEANAGITRVVELAVNEAATSRLTSTNIRDLMTGRNISLRARAEADALTVFVSGSPKDLEAGLQEAHALLTDGKIEEAAFTNWRLRALQQLDRMDKMPRFKAFEAMTELLSGGDLRRRLLNRPDVEKQTLAATQAWFDRLCREAPIEVAVVGEIELDEAMPLIAKYIGSLPKRSRSTDQLDKLRRLARGTGPLVRHVEVETITPQGMALAGFVGSQGRNVADTRALTLASQVLSSRLIKEIRENRSLVYSIGARFSPGWVYEDSGSFGAGAPCDPQNATTVVGAVHDIFQDFADSGPTEEELANAKKQVANNLDTDMKEPRYWLRVLQHHDLHGRDLAEEKIETEAYEPYTAGQVRDVFRKYYTPQRQFSVTAVPTEAQTDDSKKEEKALPAAIR